MEATKYVFGNYLKCYVNKDLALLLTIQTNTSVNINTVKEKCGTHNSDN